MSQTLRTWQILSWLPVIVWVMTVQGHSRSSTLEKSKAHIFFLLMIVTQVLSRPVSEIAMRIPKPTTNPEPTDIKDLV